MVSSDFRVDVDTNRYSVPPHLVGRSVDIVIEADLLQVCFQGKVVAEHSLHPGRHQVVEDPGHVLDFREKTQTRTAKESSGIQRSLKDYAAAAGGL